MEKQEQKIGGYRVSDILCCLGREKDYLHRFRRIEDKRKTFNFCSAILGPLWMAYRRMVAEAAIVSVLLCFATSVTPIALWKYINISYDALELICLTVFFAVHIIVLGRLGDKMYWKRIKGIMDSCRCREREEDSLVQEELKGQGGCSIVMALLCFVAEILLNIIFQEIALQIFWG